MDFATKEIFKRYTSMLIGRPISPVFLNILVTSVCDMRCTHCFFTEELDDRPRKKLQMKADEIGRISETLGGNLGVLVLAGGEPFTRKDLPEIVRSFYENNKLDSVYLMSNGQIHPRIFPDVTRIMGFVDQICSSREQAFGIAFPDEARQSQRTLWLSVEHQGVRALL